MHTKFLYGNLNTDQSGDVDVYGKLILMQYWA